MNKEYYRNAISHAIEQYGRGALRSKQLLPKFAERSDIEAIEQNIKKAAIKVADKIVAQLEAENKLGKPISEREFEKIMKLAIAEYQKENV